MRTYFARSQECLQNEVPTQFTITTFMIPHRLIALVHEYSVITFMCRLSSHVVQTHDFFLTRLWATAKVVHVEGIGREREVRTNTLSCISMDHAHFTHHPLITLSFPHTFTASHFHLISTHCSGSPSSPSIAALKMTASGTDHTPWSFFLCSFLRTLST